MNRSKSWIWVAAIGLIASVAMARHTAPPETPSNREDGPTVVYVDILRSRRMAEQLLTQTYQYHLRRWRWSAYHARCFAGLDLAWRVDHEVDDLLVHAGVLQVDDLRRPKAVCRTRVADLADDQVVANVSCEPPTTVEMTPRPPSATGRWHRCSPRCLRLAAPQRRW